MAVTLLEELVEDILERLPAKSLVRFKSVKRSWNALFKTDTFVRRHSQRQMGSNERFMIAHGDSRDLNSPMITLLSFNHPTLIRLPRAQCPIHSVFNSFFHCNGVICFYYFDSNTHGFALWNPATREFKFIPPTLLNQVQVHDPECFVTMDYKGFGADPNTFNDFKFIQFHVTFPLGGNNHTLRLPIVSAEVYNTSTNSWTVLRDVNAYDLFPFNKPLPFIFSNSTTFGNGAYHWLSNDYTYILCFDFRSNQFRTLGTPTTMVGMIFEVDDSIAYAIKHSISEDWKECQFEIWILKQDSSWTKKYNIGPFFAFIEIYAIWKDGAEFLAGFYGRELVSYSSDGQPLRWFQPLVEDVQLQLSIEYFFDIRKYVESIAPLSL